MAFRFRLEKVLKYRKLLVDRQALEMAAAGRKVAEVIGRINDLNAEIHRFESSFPSIQLQVSIPERINMVRWIEHLKKMGAQLEVEQQEALRVQEVQREKMTQAWQDLEVLKKLKGHQMELWSAENRKRESQDLDEVGIQRVDRKRREKLASI